MTTIYEKNFVRLCRIGGFNSHEEIPESSRFQTESSGMMPLTIKVTSRNFDRTIIAIAHWFSSKGRLICDPEMVLEVRNNFVEALSIQHSMGPAIKVYNEDRSEFRPRERKEQNSFLSMWLKNLADQKYQAVQEQSEKSPDELPRGQLSLKPLFASFENGGDL